MIYREYIPRLELRQFIECFWSLEDCRARHVEPQKVLPDGCIEVIFHLADPVHRVETENGLIDQPLSFVSGQIQRYIVLQPAGKLKVFGIRFRPAGAYPFLKVPLHEITDRAVAIELILGRTAKQLEVEVHEAASDRDRIRACEGFLLQNCRNGIVIEPVMMAAVERVLNCDGQLPIDDLMERIDMSGRQLERKFWQQIGLSPKKFCRIIRFHSLFKEGPKRSFGNLTALALDAGFYDQAHFIREFRDFTGQSPGAYFAGNNKMAGFFTSEERMSNFYNWV